MGPCSARISAPLSGPYIGPYGMAFQSRNFGPAVPPAGMGRGAQGISATLLDRLPVPPDDRQKKRPPGFPDGLAADHGRGLVPPRSHSPSRSHNESRSRSWDRAASRSPLARAARAALSSARAISARPCDVGRGAVPSRIMSAIGMGTAPLATLHNGPPCGPYPCQPLGVLPCRHMGAMISVKIGGLSVKDSHGSILPRTIDGTARGGPHDRPAMNRADGPRDPVPMRPPFPDGLQRDASREPERQKRNHCENVSHKSTPLNAGPCRPTGDYRANPLTNGKGRPVSRTASPSAILSRPWPV